MRGERPTPTAVPAMDARMLWLPLLAVTSARLEEAQRLAWMAAREADADRYETFLPTLAMPATSRKEPGNMAGATSMGVRISSAVAASMEMEETIRQRFGSESKPRNVPRYDAKSTPPS